MQWARMLWACSGRACCGHILWAHMGWHAVGAHACTSHVGERAYMCAFGALCVLSSTQNVLCCPMLSYVVICCPMLSDTRAHCVSQVAYKAYDAPCALCVLCTHRRARAHALLSAKVRKAEGAQPLRTYGLAKAVARVPAPLPRQRCSFMCFALRRCAP